MGVSGGEMDYMVYVVYVDIGLIWGTCLFGLVTIYMNIGIYVYVM